MSNTLRITEIFYSLQGEANTVGLPTVFIRLTGCPLRCQYCDTAYAFSGGVHYDYDQIVTEIRQYSTPHITVTGGEPLAQPGCIPLLERLCNEGYKVSLETSGALDVSKVDPRVVKVMDLKTPASGECEKNLYENLQFLDDKDQIKFVICDEEDYEWCKQTIEQHGLNQTASEILMSPSKDELAPQDLAEWILRDRLNVRFQLQLHKILWGDKEGV